MGGRDVGESTLFASAVMMVSGCDAENLEIILEACSFLTTTALMTKVSALVKQNHGTSIFMWNLECLCVEGRIVCLSPSTKPGHQLPDMGTGKFFPLTQRPTGTTCGGRRGGQGNWSYKHVPVLYVIERAHLPDGAADRISIAHNAIACIDNDKTSPTEDPSTIGLGRCEGRGAKQLIAAQVGRGELCWRAANTSVGVLHHLHHH